jgi:hypothetical protein
MGGQNAAIVFDDTDPARTGSDHRKCSDGLLRPEMHRHQRVIVVGIRQRLHRGVHRCGPKTATGGTGRSGHDHRTGDLRQRPR